MSHNGQCIFQYSTRGQTHNNNINMHIEEIIQLCSYKYEIWENVMTDEIKWWTTLTSRDGKVGKTIQTMCI